MAFLSGVRPFFVVDGCKHIFHPTLQAFIAQSQQLLRDLEHLYEESRSMVDENMESVRRVARFHALRPEIGLTGAQYYRPTEAEVQCAFFTMDSAALELAALGCS